MSDQSTVERDNLAKKSKQELRTIVEALGGKAPLRLSKGVLIDQILGSAGDSSDNDAEENVSPVVETAAPVASTPKNDQQKDPVIELDKNAPQAAVSEPQESGNTRPPKKDYAAKEESGNARRRGRRGRRGQDRDEAGNAAISTDPEVVSGFLDLRDEGYGFLRVKGFLPSKEDVYVSVKQVRQLSLRKGDHISGLSTPAHRNEKNPCFQRIDTVNGSLASSAAERPLFDSLTPLMPSEHISLELGAVSGRVVDVVAPLAKGQRGFISSPPQAGKTTFIKELADSIQTHHSDINLLVLAVDSRPEEVTEMYNHLQNGEIVASSFDASAEEHIAVAELTLERAKRLAETGEDVFIIVDNLSQLARAYMVASAHSSRSLATAVDLSALYPVKKFLGAARDLEDSGSLTILSTVTVDSGSPIDESIYQELKFSANLEIKLDATLAQGQVFPAIDPIRSYSGTDISVKGAEFSQKVRSVKSLLSEYEEGYVSGVEHLLENLNKTSSIETFLNEILQKGSL